jgi:hypothetical protein
MSADTEQVGGDHYRSKAIQPWDAMAAWMTPEEFRGYLRGNVIKYVARCNDKGGVEDLQKARHYLDKLIEVSGAGADIGGGPDIAGLDIFPLLPLVVGGKYRRRNGRIATIIQDDGTHAPFQCDDMSWLRADGTDYNKESGYDLVERIA